MAIVALGHPGMASPLPGGIGIGHDMAVDTGFRLIGQIGGGVGDAYNDNSHT
jgi:hypothetical protein